jgi:hypothetical protein
MKNGKRRSELKEKLRIYAIAPTKKRPPLDIKRPPLEEISYILIKFYESRYKERAIPG